MDPIVFDFEVAAPPDHAFRVWTDGCAVWWPKSHSMSQSEDFEVIFEPFVGGRILERGPDGAEHDWGEVTVWEPPRRVVYRWHIFLSRENATMVTVTFKPTDLGTAVRVENSGFEVFAEAAPERMTRVGSAWGALTALYRQAI